ncbi:MAG: DUF362 domain-containing protein [Candidatus Lokiarchaeota archaeon]
MVEKTKISIQKIINDNIEPAVFKALNSINAEKLFPREGMKILLKPNLLIAKPPERAATTHPEIVRAVIHWLKQFNPSKIYASDSSGGRDQGVTEKCMKVSGIQAVCEEEGAECVPFEKTERKIYEVPNPLEMKQFVSSRLLEEVDLIINLPKIKTHWQCTLTCCVKNMFGTILRVNKAKTHAQYPFLDRFSAALADIYSVSKPQLTIVDGYLCQEGDGPSKGDVVKMDLILAGFDGVALDSVVSQIVGLDPREIIPIVKAKEKGLGTMDLSEMEILGEEITSISRKFKIPRKKPISMPLPKRLADYVGKKIFKASVKFDDSKCKLCSTCWENCPVGAITPPREIKKGNIPKWNKEKCITCYCCAELCPHEAVDFKINYVKNVFTSWVGIGFIAIILILVLIILLIFIFVH